MKAEIEQEESVSKQPKKPIIKNSTKKRKWLFFAIATPIAFIVLAYGLTTYAAQAYTLPFVKYRGVDMGLKTFPEITKAVLESDKDLKEEKIKISLDGKDEEAKLGDLRVSIQSSKTADAIFNFGKKSLFVSVPTPSYFKDIITNETDAPVEMQKSTETENKLMEMFDNSKKDPVDPTLTVENGQLVITDEEPGNKIDVNDFLSKLKIEINSRVRSKVILTRVDTKSKFYKSDLDPYKQSIEDLINRRIYLSSDYKTLRLSQEDLAGFVDLERTILNQKFTISDQAMENYLNSVSRYFNISGRHKKISTVDNAVLDEGTEGRMLDITASLNNLKRAIEENTQAVALEITTSPIEEEYISPGYNPGKYPGKYIEVNLSDQMLYTFEGTQLLGSYKVSTGKWSMPTPEGEFSINSKNDRAYSQDYDLYMPYWMSFIGSEYGIHELPEWADGTKEGEAHLGTPVSHGCIRLGRGSALEVYSWAEIGIPVYVHL